MAWKDGREYYIVKENPLNVGSFAYAFREVMHNNPNINLYQLDDTGINADRLVRMYDGHIIPNFAGIEALSKRLGVKFIWIAGIGWDWSEFNWNEAVTGDVDLSPYLKC